MILLSIVGRSLTTPFETRKFMRRLISIVSIWTLDAIRSIFCGRSARTSRMFRYLSSFDGGMCMHAEFMFSAVGINHFRIRNNNR